MRTGKITFILAFVKWVSPVRVCGQDMQKTDSLFNALADAGKYAHFFLFFYWNNKLFAEKSMQVIDSGLYLVEKMWGRMEWLDLHVPGRYLCGNNNSIKL